MRRRRRRPGGVVAITGAHGHLAQRLIKRLEDDERYQKIVILDLRAPSRPVGRSVFHCVDLTAPLADALVARILRDEGVHSLVHLALRSAPAPRARAEDDLETLGTLSVLNAAADCHARKSPLSKLVTVTSTMVYGADARNPHYLREGAPLRGDAQDRFVRDQVDVEAQIAGFREEVGLPICVLRPCWTVGGGDSVAERVLGQAVPVTVLGFDPLLQVLHIDDLADALKAAVDRNIDGELNVVPKGVLPLSSVLRLRQRSAMSLPASLAYPAADLLWRTSGSGPGVSLDYLRYVWLADGERARAELGFQPRYDTRGAIETWTAAQ